MSDDDRTEIRPLYDKDTIDTQTFGSIEEMESMILVEMHLLSPEERASKLKNLFSKMYQKLSKYVSDDPKKAEEEIRKLKVMINNEQHDFFEAWELVSYDSISPDDARDALNVGFTCYDILMKRHVGIGVPIVKHNWRKKLVARLYSLAIPLNGLDKFYEEQIWKPYMAFGCHDTPLNFAAFCEYRMPFFDLDQHHIVIGVKRSSKSTYVLQAIRRKTAFEHGFKSLAQADTWLVKNHFIEHNYFFSKEQNLTETLLRAKKQRIVADDAVIVSDKRQGMQADNIALTQMINIAADNNNEFYSLIQNKKLIDQRFIDTASRVTIILRRGEAAELASGNGYGLINQFEGLGIFDKKPWMLSDYDKAVHYLSHLPAYVRRITYNALGSIERYNETGRSGNIFFDDYLNNKKRWRSKERPQESLIFLTKRSPIPES